MSPPDPAPPADTRLLVLASTDDLLIVQTPSEIWRPGLWLLAGLGALLLCFLVFQSASAQRSESVGAIEFFGVIVLALTAFVSTHKWLRVGPEGIECQLRLGPRTLSTQRALLDELGAMSVGEVETEQTAGGFYLILATTRWQMRFGMERDAAPIEWLIAKISSLQERGRLAPVSAPSRGRAAPAP